MSPRFDDIPSRSDPDYLRPPDKAYEEDDSGYRLRQATNHLISERLKERLTGDGEDCDVIYGVEPQRKFFAGVLSSQYRYREAKSDEDSSGGALKDVAPFSMGLKFQLPKDIDDDASIKIKPNLKLFYRRHPSFEEQREHAGLTAKEEQMQTTEEVTMPDGGEAEPEEKTLVKVYERIDPDTSIFEVTGTEIKAAASDGGGTLIEELEDTFEAALDDLQSDDKRMRLPAEGSTRSDRENVPSQALESKEDFHQHLEEVFSEEPMLPLWQADLRVRVEPAKEDVLEVSVRLVNTHGESFPDTEESDGDWQTHLFDTGISVECKGGSFEPFPSEEIDDEFQYDGDLYALGENCAAVENADEKVTKIETSTVPIYEQPKYISRESMSLPFAELSGEQGGTSGADVDRLLSDVEEEMQRALEQYESVRDDVLEGKSSVAEEDFDEAIRSFEEERIRFAEGRELISESDDVRKAFEMMNRAFDEMGEKYVEWRLFQLVFIVMNIPDIFAQSDSERGVEDCLDTGDVIYFPTGGGKTEAYLGLVTFTAFYDRLRGKEFGTTAWSKFPLRLLSLQQLQRISEVLCSAEELRREEPDMEGDEFSVGYFVGNQNTPNKTVESEDINNVQRAKNDQQYKKEWLIVSECPFCGEETVEIDGDLERMRILHRCTNGDCSEDELPIYISDREIYRYAPTFIVSTIDKVAVIGMQRRARTMFGQVKKKCPEHGYTAEDSCLADGYDYPEELSCDQENLERVEPVDPPSIMIQDELHLLREEFGTFNSHYETFINEWVDRVTDDGWEFKNIAATATIAGAEEQVRSLYWKDANIYPSPGPRLRQSFYAYEHPNKVGRRMMGALPRCVSRTYAINMAIRERAQIVQELQNDLDHFVDALKSEGTEGIEGELELPQGGDMDRALQDLLKQYETQISYNISKKASDLIQRSAKTMINPQLEEMDDVYEPLTAVSMTGETSMEDVRDFLTRLESDSPENPIDLVIATSMISHGVDVDKFNFISFFGMPRNTAEYIQSYSRVGRKNSGTVFVLFNPMRARDRSHYTRFHHYHRYQDLLVEATPLERWAEFAIDCTLPGIFSGILIQYYDHLLEDEYEDRVYMYDGLEEAVRDGSIDKDEMLDFVLKSYSVKESQKEDWTDSTGMKLYRGKIESKFDEIWQRVLERPTNPKKTWIGHLIERREEDRGPMRSLRDVDEQIPVYPEPDAGAVIDMISRNS